jgi:hypothetical protein
MSQKAKSHNQFKKYLKKKDEFNVLYPSERFLSVSPIHRLTPEIVLIDPDPLNGEVYQLRGGAKTNAGFRDEFVITKRGLEKIAWAAGIRFHPRYTRRTDDGHNPRRVEFQAVGSIQKPDGSWYTISRSKEINLDAIEQEVRRSLEALAEAEGLTVETERGPRRLLHGSEECTREITLRTEREMLKQRKNMVAAADSGAYSRVVRSLLNIHPTYSAEELARPFVVPSVALDLDSLLSQSWIRDGLIKTGLAATFNIFGPALEEESRIEVGEKKGEAA